MRIASTTGVGTLARVTSRAWAVVVLVVLVAAFVAVTAWTIPWRERPPSRADQLDALGDIPAEQVARGRAFSAARRPATYASMLVGLAVLLALGLTTAGSHVVAAVGSVFGGGWYAEAIPGGLALVLLTSIVTLPFAAWRHRVARDFGLSTQGWRGWAVDVLKGYAVESGDRRPRAGSGSSRWYGQRPTPGGSGPPSGAAALVVLLSFVLPVLVEPVFNKFTPMADSPLRADLIALADGGRRTDPGRTRGRRVPAHERGQRVRLRLRCHPSRRRLRHAAQPGDRGRGRAAWWPTNSVTPRTTTC